MWVYRSVLYIKPGLMAEAIANLRENPLPAGIRQRLSRPLNGAEAANQLIQEFELEDIDAGAASYGRPGPESESSKRFIELNQNRGHRELYQVLHTLPSEGPPGLWVDRRTRFCPRMHVEEALALWRATPRLAVPGYSMRILRPRTSSERTEPLVIEMTAASLAKLEEALIAQGGTSEHLRMVIKLAAWEEGYPIRELLRVVE
jgi:hypothetical protein